MLPMAHTDSCEWHTQIHAVNKCHAANGTHRLTSQLTLMLSTSAMPATAHTDSCEQVLCWQWHIQTHVVNKCHAANGTHRLMLSTSAMLAMTHTQIHVVNKCHAGNDTHRFMLSTSAMLAMTHTDSCCQQVPCWQ